jgi:hypothetical protein
MQSKYKEYGGGQSTGLANDFMSFLSQGLNTGTFGTGNAMGSDSYSTTTGMAGVINDILSGGAGEIGGSMQDMITRSNDRSVNDMRSRFGVQGGTAFGTGAQFAEGTMRAEQAPMLTSTIGQLQMQMLAPILQMMFGAAQKGTSQRQGTMSPSPLASGLNILANGLSQVLPMAGGGPGNMAASTPAIAAPPASIPMMGMTPPSIQRPPGDIPWIMPSISSYGLH